MVEFPLIAVHISDYILAWQWQMLGLIGAGALLAWSGFRIGDDEIPRIGVLSAVFFVSSLIHVRVGPTSVHLLLNGLVGLILGRRAVIAISVGLLLQALMLGHGGFLVIGVNVLILSLPALAAPALFRSLSLESRPSFRLRNGGLAVSYLLWPPLMLAFTIISLIRLLAFTPRAAPSTFQTGFAVGALTVLMTVTLNSLVLIFGGIENWSIVAGLVWAAHVPIAIIEGIIVGFTAEFLMRVRPSMLQCVSPGNTSSNGTSH